MRFLYVAICILCLCVLTIDSSAQGDCGNGLPCGPIPWSLPEWPDLNSPTPLIPDVDVNPLDPTPTPTPTITPIPTLTPIPTATPPVTAEYLEDAVATAAAQIEVTAEVYYFGTPIPDAMDGVGSNLLFFSYAKGLTSSSFGIFSPIVSLFILFFAVSLFFSLVNLGIWAVKLLVSFVVNVVLLVLRFIPFVG